MRREKWCLSKGTGVVAWERERGRERKGREREGARGRQQERKREWKRIEREGEREREGRRSKGAKFGRKAVFKAF